MLAIDYQDRLRRAFELIGDGAMLVVAQPEAVRNSDVDHSFRQESFFYYLTGFLEPGSALLLSGHGGKSQSTIFLRERDKLAELWVGRRLGVQAAPQELGVDQAFKIDELWERLPALVKGSNRLYFQFGISEDADQHVGSLLRKEKRLRGRHSFAHNIPIYDAQSVAGALRAVKTQAEMERMRKAAEITAKGFERVFTQVRPGMNERSVHGMLVGSYMENGAEMEAYGAIVAGGKNACCLHYHENRAPLKEGELLLIDSGAQYEYYACDVTRTFPIGKSFSSEQRDIYNVVLQAQETGIEMSKPGTTMQEIHKATIKSISQGLIDIGLCKGGLDKVIAEKEYFKYFPHGTGHWLGLDVHDVGDYVSDGKDTVLEPGMCFTVEPGIYVDPEDESAPAGFRGVGVRIEDDIHITSGAPEVLTASIPKKVSDMENRY